MFGDFADVQQAVRSGEQFDECAEFGQSHYFAQIRFSNFSGCGDVANHLKRGVASGAAGREDMHGTIFQYVDLDARGFDDRADFLATRPDEIANFVLWNFQLEQTRSVSGNAGASLAKRLFHDIENMQSGFFRLRESFTHHRNADSQNLDVHLKRGDAGAGPGDLEVHIAVMILGSGNVRQNRVFIVFPDDQAHCDSGAGSLQRYACVHQRERSTANAGHGGGAVGVENVRHNAHGVRKIRFRRKQARQGALSKGAVSNFSPPGSTQKFNFTYAEWRKIVGQHKALEVILREKQVKALHVFFRTESEGGERLRFAASKQRGAVNTWQQANFASNLAHLIECAPVRPAMLVEHLGAENIFA